MTPTPTTVTLPTFPSGAPLALPLGQIEEVLGAAPGQAGVKLRGGELVIVLLSPEEVNNEIARVWPVDPLPPLPQLEPSRVLRLIKERVAKRGGHRFANVPPTPNLANSFETEALAHVLCEEFNRVLKEALEGEQDG